MKIIKPSVQLFGEVPTEYKGCLEFIERCGRLCYKSEGEITADSAEGFVRMLIKAGRWAMVEHSNFVVRLDRPYNKAFEDRIKGIVGKYLNFFHLGYFSYIGGSLTAWAQASQLVSNEPVFFPFYCCYAKIFSVRTYYQPDWQVCPHNEIPKELHRYSAKFICDRGVSHELVRHRPCSFAQESTRYVNYGGKDMEFIEPWWCNDAYGTNNGAAQYNNFEQMCLFAEELYKDQLGHGQAPQAARAVLPNALKTEIVVTADAAEWAHIRKLRTASDAHPDIQRVMNMMPWEEFLCES